VSCEDDDEVGNIWEYIDAIAERRREMDSKIPIPPGFRVVEWNEEVEKGDFFYSPCGGAIRWVPTTAFGERASTTYIRRIVPAPSLRLPGRGIHHPTCPYSSRVAAKGNSRLGCDCDESYFPPPGAPPIKLRILPGESTPQDAANLLEALAQLYRAYGGTGIDLAITPVEPEARMP